MKRLVLLAAAAMSLAAAGAQAQEKLKIGIIATLSGPPAVLGQQLRNGFNLAVKTLDGKDFVANAGDLIRLPMGIAHGIFNKSDQPVKCFFWVAPTRALYDLFWAIHSMKEQKPEEVVALAAKHEVVFLPPPQ